MSNIYEEALEELKCVWNGNELTYPKKTIEALERAKKVEELLGLYQRKDIYGKTILPYKEYLKICDEIIIKEKELEELK